MLTSKLSFSPLPLSLPFAPQQIMKDRWMNVGHEDDELKPYVEPLPDYKDPRRTGEAAAGPGGWTYVDVEASLTCVFSVQS